MAGKYDHRPTYFLPLQTADELLEIQARNLDKLRLTLTEEEIEEYLRGPSIEAQRKWRELFTPPFKRKRAATGVGLAQRARAPLFPDGVVPDQIELPNGDLIRLVHEQLKKMGLLKKPRSISPSSILRAFGRKR
jgi:hypothetical protein